MGIVDELKDLFGQHAQALQERMHGIENHLNAVRKSSDYAASELQHELRRMTFLIAEGNKFDPTIRESGQVLFTVPPGSYWELLNWTWICSENEKPIIQINNEILDVGLTSVTRGARQSTGQIILPENAEVRGCSNNVNKPITLTMLVRMYKKQPPYIADVESSE